MCSSDLTKSNFSLASLGTEAEIALRLLYRELEELREREDEEAIALILAHLL